MMIRILLLLLAAGGLPALASDPIATPYSGASVSASGPHVTAELVPEKTGIEPGEPFDVALHLHMDPGWHTYWINPGDAGLATTIKWTLPPGFTAGPIQWPTPEKHSMGPEITYGYEGDTYLLTTITPPKGDLPRHFDISAHTTWLVCQEECIPGKADLTLHLDGGLLNLRLPVDNSGFFDEARGRLPVENTIWNVESRYDIKPGVGQPGQQALWIQFKNKLETGELAVGHLYFFPEQENVLNANEDDNGKPDPAQKLSKFILALTLQQNGLKPDTISGVLVSDRPLIGNSSSVYISSFSTNATDIPILSASLTNPAAQQGIAAINADTTQAATTAPPLGTAAATSETATTAQPLLLLVLGSAFVGGLILNLMPCVLPVLSLKVFALVRHAGENPGAAWRQGAAFTAGVVISFWVLAGLLLALRAAGNQLGWGFQMQSPGFVLALIFLFFLLALNLFGVFEVGASLVGLDAKATSHVSGLTSSFLNGALATLAATPCTAPYMGWALGVAAQQSAAVALLIFTFLALGMATPYLLLTIFPGALRFVPKPGAWMEAVRQFMGFLLLATVIWLVYVVGALVGQEQVPLLLGLLLLAGLAAWIYGRWIAPPKPPRVRVVAGLFAIFFALVTVKYVVDLARMVPPVTSGAEAASDGWQPWKPEAVSAALAQGKPVFVDFTAAWCLSCKVNEAVALGTDAVKQAFTDKNVALFRADWTHSDPAISTTLQKYNRDGVPLYLLYSPKTPDAPQVLPEALTPGIVLDALKGL
ncbi:MAG: thioredoxin family protein [Methylacidiphilales bacterium]|nr:thioredoxin family protein [Candidatus Methylacidiphilales bacterium]